jgi:cation diffusion facilitator CzcD-associated flavoprotein CzcO
MPHIKFHHEYVRGRWNPQTNSYDLILKTPSGEKKVNHKILVSAIGGFSVPLFPNVPGLKEYKGKVIHTLEWPKDLGVEDLKGKEVMVVGNGCSG